MAGIRDIVVVGLGHIGLPLAVTLAKVGYRVFGADVSLEVIREIREGRPRIHEPGLAEATGQYLGRGLSIGTLDELPAAPGPRALIICVPSNQEKGESAPDLRAARSAAAWIGAHANPGDLLIVRSTVPIGTTRNVLLPLLESGGLRAGVDVHVAFCPERVLEGAVLRELGKIPQIVGGVDEASAALAATLFAPLTPHVVRVSSLEAAETVKLVDNVFRDTRFAFANQLAHLCEALGVDSREVVRAANFEYSRNSIPVPSPGVGGSCIPKDSRFMRYSVQAAGIELPLVAAARQVNEATPVRLARRLRDLRPLRGARVFVAGFAFKGIPATADVRESPTREFLDELAGDGANLIGYDPVVSGETITAFGARPVSSLGEGLRDCEVAVFMTNHTEFQMSVEELARLLPAGAVIVDGWSLFDRAACVARGFEYLAVGTGTLRTAPLAATPAALA